jgi:hypothetical protein
MRNELTGMSGILSVGVEVPVLLLEGDPVIAVEREADRLWMGKKPDWGIVGEVVVDLEPCIPIDEDADAIEEEIDIFPCCFGSSTCRYTGDVGLIGGIVPALVKPGLGVLINSGEILPPSDDMDSLSSMLSAMLMIRSVIRSNALVTCTNASMTRHS